MRKQGGNEMEIWIVWILFTLAWINPKIPLSAMSALLRGKKSAEDITKEIPAKEELINWLKSSLKGILAGAVISFIILYWIMPPTLPIVVIMFFFILVFLNDVLRGLADNDNWSAITAGISGTMVIIFFCIAMFAGPFYASDLYKIPQVTISSDNTTDKISVEHIRTVPKETAEWKADKKVGELGYKVETTEAHIQFRSGELVWLVPLEYGGLWKAYKYSNEGTEGYIRVSAEKPYQEAERITGFQLKYLSSAVFGEYLRRHIYFAYPNYYQKESVFQLDDKGNPIWVTMLTRPTIGYTGEKPVGVLITNAQTGDINFYELQNVPPYIQRIMDESLTETYLSWWGAYIYGWWNSEFSQKDVKRPTGGVEAYIPRTSRGTGEIKIDEGDPDVYLIYGNDKKLYWFTSITTAGKDLSMLGYTLTDIRTGKIIFYKTEGYFNDIGAAKNVQQHAEVSKVMGFRVSQPIMYMLEGQETWIIPVLASTNEIREFGIVHAKTGATFVKEKLEDALVEYKQWLTGKSTRPSEDIIATIIIQKDEKGGLRQEIPIYKNSTITIST